MSRNDPSGFDAYENRRKRQQTLITGLVILVAVLVIVAGFVAVKIRGAASEDARNAAEPSFDFRPPAEQQVSVVAPSEGPLHVSVIGDSFLTSLFATPPGRGFDNLVYEELGKSAQVAGNTIASAPGSVAESTQLEFDTNAAVAFVAIGSWDVYARTNVSDFAHDYGLLLDLIVEASPDVKLVCMGTFALSSVGGRYDTAIEKKCTDRGGVVRRINDVYSALKNRARKDEDGDDSPPNDAYPNAAGHQAIANRLAQAVAITR